MYFNLSISIFPFCEFLQSCLKFIFEDTGFCFLWHRSLRRKCKAFTETIKNHNDPKYYVHLHIIVHLWASFRITL